MRYKQLKFVKLIPITVLSLKIEHTKNYSPTLEFRGWGIKGLIWFIVAVTPSRMMAMLSLIINSAIVLNLRFPLHREVFHIVIIYDFTFAPLI